MSRVLLALLALLTTGLAAGASFDPTNLPTVPEIERYQDIIRELRCLVCQNQSLADSNAPLAQDMRAVVVQMMSSGANKAEIISFMTDRFGNFVNYRPPFQATTALLWLAPFALVLVVLASVVNMIRRDRGRPLDSKRREAARRLLQKD